MFAAKRARMVPDHRQISSVAREPSRSSRVRSFGPLLFAVLQEEAVSLLQDQRLRAVKLADQVAGSSCFIAHKVPIGTFEMKRTRRLPIPTGWRGRWDMMFRVAELTVSSRQRHGEEERGSGTVASG